jgi:hypothetical protein
VRNVHSASGGTFLSELPVPANPQEANDGPAILRWQSVYLKIQRHHGSRSRGSGGDRCKARVSSSLAPWPRSTLSSCSRRAFPACRMRASICASRSSVSGVWDIRGLFRCVLMMRGTMLRNDFQTVDVHDIFFCCARAKCLACWRAQPRRDPHLSRRASAGGHAPALRQR